MHIGAERKLRPALMHIGRTTAKVRLKSEEMRLAVVRSEYGFTGETLAGYLIAHLIVLMRPHIVAYSSRERVECEDLESLRPFVVARVCKELLVGVHLLDNAAKLGAVYRTDTRETFVTREKSDGCAVVFVKTGAELLCRIGVFFAEKLV